MRQLDAAVAALRGVVSIAASADALARLSDEVRMLSSRIERLNGAGDRAPVPAQDRSAPLPAVRRAGAMTAIGRIPGPSILRRLPWSRQLRGSERGTAGRDGGHNRRGGGSVTAFDMRSLRLVSGTAAVLVTAFVTAMTMFQAVQPRVQVPTTSQSHRLAARQAQSFLISPVPILSQSFKPAPLDHGGEASAGLEDPRHEPRAPGRQSGINLKPSWSSD
jgi:hypothetical protein